ncbi:MAG: hypothetical protein AVDCRST_MAG16-182, partial [uncultured Frankineae bacterium]
MAIKGACRPPLIATSRMAAPGGGGMLPIH